MSPAQTSRLQTLLQMRNPSRDAEARAWTEAERAEFEALALLRMRMDYLRRIVCTRSPLTSAELDEHDTLAALMEE